MTLTPRDPHPGPGDGTPDIVVVGAGVVGLALALALARAGFSVVSLGPAPLARTGRTVALLDGSWRMLRRLDVWPRLDGRTAPLATMRIVDDTGSLFTQPPLDFHAAEIGLPAFGHNVDNADLVAALLAGIAAEPALARVEDLLSNWDAGPTRATVRTSAGVTIRPRLLIAADGAASAARTQARIAVRDHRYPQVALTAVLHHERPHGAVSTEFHTREGPFTLVPLPPLDGAAHRSSLVWVMTPGAAERRLVLATAELDDAVTRQSHWLLGRAAVRGAVGRFPIRRLVAERLTAPRLALAGEAAHALPPIGAQGLNLSLRDAAVLVDELVRARGLGLDIGSEAVLRRYERGRTGDIALRAAGVGALNTALLTALPPVDALRGASMAALARLPALRRAVMRQGLMPQGAVPPLMR